MSQAGKPEKSLAAICEQKTTFAAQTNFLYSQ